MLVLLLVFVPVRCRYPAIPLSCHPVGPLSKTRACEPPPACVRWNPAASGVVPLRPSDSNLTQPAARVSRQRSQARVCHNHDRACKVPLLTGPLQRISTTRKLHANSPIAPFAPPQHRDYSGLSVPEPAKQGKTHFPYSFSLSHPYMLRNPGTPCHIERELATLKGPAETCALELLGHTRRERLR